MVHASKSGFTIHSIGKRSAKHQPVCTVQPGFVRMLLQKDHCGLQAGVSAGRANDGALL